MILPCHSTENVDYAGEVDELDPANIDKFYLYLIQLTAAE